jgi:allophanate hydrolase subunit 2
MADRQTTGGYAKLGCVATIDLPILAQKKPGDQVRFMAIDLAQAQALDAARQDAFAELEVQLTAVRQCIREVIEPVDHSGEPVS